MSLLNKAEEVISNAYNSNVTTNEQHKLEKKSLEEWVNKVNEDDLNEWYITINIAKTKELFTYNNHPYCPEEMKHLDKIRETLIFLTMCSYYGS